MMSIFFQRYLLTSLVKRFDMFVSVGDIRDTGTFETSHSSVEEGGSF